MHISKTSNQVPEQRIQSEKAGENLHTILEASNAGMY